MEPAHHLPLTPTARYLAGRNDCCKGWVHGENRAKYRVGVDVREVDYPDRGTVQSGVYVYPGLGVFLGGASRGFHLENAIHGCCPVPAPSV